MTPHMRLHGVSKRSVLALVGFLLVAGLLSTSPAAAHTFTRTDGNDSPSKIDLKSVSVSHRSAASVVHKLQTFNAWTPQSLGHDSFFIIQIDKNNDRNYERCAFIFYTTRLRGSLTNCGAVFIRYLPVAKLSGTTAKVTIPTEQTGNVYWWAGVSVWDGPSPCANACVDFAPNLFPDILHDMKRPVVTLSATEPIYVWEISTSPVFDFPFTVTDANSGVGSWTVQRRPLGTASWSSVVSGTGGGTRNPDVTGTEGETADYRVLATDKQGNTKASAFRVVYTPTDQDALGPAGTYTGTHSTVDDTTAYGDTVEQLDDGTIFSYNYEATPCSVVFLIGPGDEGPWSVDVAIDGNPPYDTFTSTEFPDGPRQTLFQDYFFSPHLITFTVTGTGFAIDAVLGNPT